MEAIKLGVLQNGTSLRHFVVWGLRCLDEAMPGAKARRLPKRIAHPLPSRHPYTLMPAPTSWITAPPPSLILVHLKFTRFWDVQPILI